MNRASLETREASIDWACPPTRTRGERLAVAVVGAGATRDERRLLMAAVAAATGLAVARAAYAGGAWTVLQWAVAIGVVFDLSGGIVVNATSAGKRWYHRAGRGLAEKIIFVALHFHPFLLAWLFAPSGWYGAAVVYGTALSASTIILLTPLYLRRPMAAMLCGLSIPVGYLFFPLPSLEWFVPFFFIKLLVSYSVREEPYAPSR